MIAQFDQKNANIVTFSFLVIMVGLLFQISILGGYSEPKDLVVEAEDNPQLAALVDAGSEPVIPKSADYRALTVHQVESGDDLYWIATTYGISVQELRKLNRLESDMIRVGERLVVPIDRIRYYPVGVHLTAQEVEWLAQMIHAEARGEPYLGQVAVGAVILNRMLSSQFPDTLRGVLFQRNAFQPIQNGSFNMTPNASARKAALEAIDGHDPTEGAVFFFNPRQSTDRFMHSRTAKVTIGRHRFAN